MALDRLGHNLDRAAKFARHEAGLDAQAGDLARQALADFPRGIQGLATEAIETGDKDHVVAGSRIVAALAASGMNLFPLREQQFVRDHGAFARTTLAGRRRRGRARLFGAAFTGAAPMHQRAVQPPSMENCAPVTWSAAAEQRNSAMPATWSTVTNSLVGCDARKM